MGGNPSGRGQTLQLAAWLQDKVSACTDPQPTHSDIQLLRQTQKQQATNQPCRSISGNVTANVDSATAEETSTSHVLTDAEPAAEGAAVDSASGPLQSMAKHGGQKPDEVKKAAVSKEAALGSPRAAWRSPRGRMNNNTSVTAVGCMHHAGTLKASHLPSSASQLTLCSWQDLLPKASESLGLASWAGQIIKEHAEQGRTVLGLLGNAFAVLVHQVAMHCFERGSLMASVWNMYTALMDAEVQFLEEHAQVRPHTHLSRARASDTQKTLSVHAQAFSFWYVHSSPMHKHLHCCTPHCLMTSFVIFTS